jgi:hypothetical protein
MVGNGAILSRECSPEKLKEEGGKYNTGRLIRFLALLASHMMVTAATP